MGNMKVRQGKCEQCGEDGKSLRLVFKKSVCSRCEAVRRAAYNVPRLVVSSLVEAKGQEWLAGLLKMTDIPPANVIDLEGDVAAKDMELEALRKEFDGMDLSVIKLKRENINLERTAKAQTKEIKALTTFAVNKKKALANAKEALNDIFDKYNTLSDESENLKTRIADLLEQNKNLEQARFNLSVQVERLNASAVVEAEDDKSYSLAGGVSFDATNEAQLAIFTTCEKLCGMLIRRNQSYGNSALDPLRLFSKASAREQLLVRIDDQLTLFTRGIESSHNTTIVNLVGYLVLLLAHDRMEGPWVTA